MRERELVIPGPGRPVAGWRNDPGNYSRDSRAFGENLGCAFKSVRETSSRVDSLTAHATLVSRQMNVNRATPIERLWRWYVDAIALGGALEAAAWDYPGDPPGLERPPHEPPFPPGSDHDQRSRVSDETPVV